MVKMSVMITKIISLLDLLYYKRSLKFKKKHQNKKLRKNKILNKKKKNRIKLRKYKKMY